MRFSLYLLFTILILGCQSAGPSSTSTQPVTGNTIATPPYRLGETRDSIIARHGKPNESGKVEHLLNPNRLQERDIRYVREQLKLEPVSYDVFYALGGKGSSIASVDIYMDYVYYDTNERCIWFDRHKID